MEYAIAAGVTAVFIALYVILRPRPREAFDATLKENELVSAAKEFAASLPAPSDGGGNAPAQPYARYVKRALRAKSPDPLISRIFEMLGEKREELKKLASEDFAPLQDLPCVNGKVRCVCVAETVLGHSKYIFCRERAEGVIKAFNEVRALTFAETDAMEKAFRYVLLKKLGFLCKNACLAERLRRGSGNWSVRQSVPCWLLPLRCRISRILPYVILRVQCMNRRANRQLSSRPFQ